MGTTYRSIQWNPRKRLYDLVAVGGLCLYLVGFITASLVLSANADPMIVTIRAFGSAAFILLHVVLSIGPLCRLRPGLLPLLYNRRHLGVITFLTGLIHAMLVTFYYHLGGPTHPILSIFLSSSFSGDPAWLPFQPFGFVALVILFLMAATSHDFWLNQLSAPVWKSLHMLVYVAYALLVVHVAFGILQSEQSPLFVWATAAGMTGLFSLHLVAGRGSRAETAPRAVLRTRRVFSRWPVWTTSGWGGQGSSAWQASGSRFSNIRIRKAARFRSMPYPTFADIRTGRWVKERLSTVASPAPGTVISTCPATGARLLRSPRRSRPFASA
ncbi:MAG: ferric reductase-like transmembrane domain-containing protein [Opitutaceae bacterium]